MGYWQNNLKGSNSKRPNVVQQEKTGGLPTTSTVRNLIKEGNVDPKEWEFYES